jgi:ectoine hydroxylase-related dioxygenase (phytanoyl-CoA dioxygenase family)
MIASLLIFLHSIVILSWIFAGSLYYIREYYGPTFHFPDPFGKEKYLDHCDPTTDNLEDLLVDESYTQEQAKAQTETHGVAFVKQILSPSTSSNLRTYILKANHEIEGTFVKNNERRFHIITNPTEPTIKTALKEIASHSVFRPLIDGVLGPSSSLVALSVITNLYGAEGQDWHFDTGMSDATHPSYFVPEYTLAIPLQDTTNEMGATAICPGTHKCADVKIDYEAMQALYYEEQHLVQRKATTNTKENDHEEEGVVENEDSSDDNEEEESEDDHFDQWLAFNYPCNVTAQVNAGDGMLYNADLYHRGGTHSDPTAGERVVMFITFAGSRQLPTDQRSLPLGTIHSLHWKSWGHTIDDFLTMDEQPWRLWHILGWFSPSSKEKQQNGARPWTMVDYFFMIFQHEVESMHPISDDFDLEYFSELVDMVILYTACMMGGYLLVAPLLWMLVLRGWTRKPSLTGNNKIKRE